jgi:hypothetical protein
MQMGYIACSNDCYMNHKAPPVLLLFTVYHRLGGSGSRIRIRWVEKALILSRSMFYEIWT